MVKKWEKICWKYENSTTKLKILEIFVSKTKKYLGTFTSVDKTSDKIIYKKKWKFEVLELLKIPRVLM